MGIKLLLNRIIDWFDIDNWTPGNKLTAIGIVIGLVYFIITQLQIDTPTDYEATHRPNLEAELVIHKIDSTGIHYYFLLENKGVLPATNLNYSIKNENLILSDFDGEQKDITQNGQLKIRDPILFKTSSINLRNFNKFLLTASYETQINGELKKFHTIFRFIIPFDEIEVGNYRYDDIRRREGAFTRKMTVNEINKSFSERKPKRKISDKEIIDATSYLMYLRLKDSIIKRPQYIFDIGKNLSENRVSLYLNKKNDLVFRIIGNNKLSDSLKIKYHPNLFKTFLNLHCEYSYGKDFTILKVFINDHVMENRIKRKIIVGGANSPNGILGADINNEYKGAFKLNRLAIVGDKLKVKERIEIIKYFHSKKEIKYYDYDGETSRSLRDFDQLR